MLCVDASTYLRVNVDQSIRFFIHQFIHQGFLLAQTLYMLVIEAIDYLMQSIACMNLLRGISLLNSPQWLINEHFVNDNVLLSNFWF